MKPAPFEKYKTENFFDEMFGNSLGEPLLHYQKIFDRISRLTPVEIAEKRSHADSSFLEHGITFTVYGDEEGTEKIFPFDLGLDRLMAHHIKTHLNHYNSSEISRHVVFPPLKALLS